MMFNKKDAYLALQDALIAKAVINAEHVDHNLITILFLNFVLSIAEMVKNLL